MTEIYTVSFEGNYNQEQAVSKAVEVFKAGNNNVKCAWSSNYGESNA